MGFCSSCLGTCGLWGIWLLMVINYLVHVVLRPIPWNSTSVVTGYLLWFLQLACFWRVQTVDPGRPSDEWTASAMEGNHAAVVCKRSGRLLPERAMYVHRAGGVVLGLDHYCSWLGTPVGLYNRKMFILFVFYSAIFCAMGAAHSLFALLCQMPDALLPMHETAEAATAAALNFPAPPPANCRHVGLPASLYDAFSQRRVGPILYESLAACHRGFGILLHVLEHAHDVGQLFYATLLTLTVPANILGAILLGLMATEQMTNVMRNATTLEPDETRYNVGMSRNWRQVFGDQPMLWALPTTPNVRAETDGYSWPLNPSLRVGGSRRGGGSTYAPGDSWNGNGHGGRPPARRSRIVAA